MEIILHTIIFSLLCFFLSQALFIHYSTFGFFDLSLAGTLIISPNIYYYLNSLLTLSSFLSIVLTLFISTFFSFLFYRIIYIPLKERRFSNVSLLVISIGIYGVLLGLIGLLIDNETKIIHIPYLGEASNFSIILVFIILNLILWVICKYTNFGKICRALFTNAELVSIQGISIRKQYYFSSCLTSLIFGLTGLYLAQEYGITNFIGFEYLLYGLSILLISGNYFTIYLLIASIIFSFTIDLSAFFLGGQWKIAIAFLTLIIILLFNPSGLSRKKNKKIGV